MDAVEEELIATSNILNEYNFPFFYRYYTSGGAINFVLQQLSNIIITIFTGILTYHILMIRWSKLLHDYELVYSEMTYSFWDVIVIGNIATMSLFCAWFILFLLNSLGPIYKAHRYVQNVLTADNAEFTRLTWEDIIGRIASRHGSDRDLLLNDVNGQIMKYDNIMNSLIAQNVLNLNYIENRKYRLPYTEINTWAIKQLIMNIGNLGRFQFTRLSYIYGIVFVTLIPFTFIPVIVYILIRQAEQFHAKKDRFSPRNWTKFSQARFQRYNELPHHFRMRMFRASHEADRYLVHFSNPITSTVAKTVSLISGAVMSILAILALINEEILVNAEFLDRNLLTWAAIFSASFAVSRFILPNPQDLLIDQKETMTKLTDLLGLNDEMSNYWINNAGKDGIYIEVSSVYRYRIIILLRELLSYVTLPYLFFVIMPRNYGKIRKFSFTQASELYEIV